METNNVAMDWSWLIGLLIIGGIVGGNGFFGNNNKSSDITNEFIYNQLANDVKANGMNINSVDRDVLTQTNTLQASINANQSAMQLCCCDLKTAIHSEGEATRSLITSNRIADLEKDLVNANTIISNQVQSQNLLNNLGRYIPYGYYNGTTIQ